MRCTTVTYGRLGMRIFGVAAGLTAALTVLPLSVAQAQPTAVRPNADAGCDLATMPALPPGADQQPAARTGYDWTPGHYRCTRGGWSYQAGFWRRAGALVDATAFVIARNGRLAPRAGYQFVRQGNGFTVARVAGGGRGGLGVGGNFACVCRRGTGGCGIATSQNELTCIQDGCTGGCDMTFVILNATGGVTRYSRRARLPVYLETDCRDARSDVSAALASESGAPLPL